jgi:integrase
LAKTITLKAKITKRFVDGLKPDPDGGRVIVRDTETPGFNLLVLPSGVMSYRLQYRTAQGVQREPTIGKHGDWTPDQARKRAWEMRQEIKSGHDPLAAKRERAQALTVAAMLDAYVGSDRFAGNAPSTQAIDRGRVERHLKPLLGRKHVDILTPGEIERTRVAIRDGKTAGRIKTGKRGLARVRGGEGAARMSLWLLRSACNWALSEKLIKSNPCSDLKTGSSGTRDVIIENADAYGRLFRTLQKMEDEKRIRAPVADAIRLIALTGARRGEVAALRWSYVDLKRGVLTLPPTAHKTGHKSGKPKTIGLPSAAQAIIARQPAGAAGAYVFAPSQGSGPLSLSKPWRAVRVEAELPETIGLHGLRHSLASHMAMNGAEAAEIMTALGHRQLSTAQRYVHWARDARQALAERAAAVALAGMAAAAGDKMAEIASLKRQ